MSYTVTSAYCWYNEGSVIVRMYFLNYIPFTFDDLLEGQLHDQDIITEANLTKSYEPDDVFKGSNYLVMEEAHPCFYPVELTNPQDMPDMELYYDEEDLMG